MRKILLAALFLSLLPMAIALPVLVVSDIQAFDEGSSPVDSLSISNLQQIDVLVKKTQNSSACDPAQNPEVRLDIDQVDTGISILINPPAIAVFAAPNSGETETVSFLADALDIRTSTAPGNYRIQAAVYCNNVLVHRSAEVIAILEDSEPISIPETLPLLSILIALSVCAAVFGFEKPSFRIKNP